MKNILKKYKLPIATLIIYLIVFSNEPTIFFEGIEITFTYLQQMVEILPAVFILTGLLEIWVPRDVILDHFGSGSGIKGRLISIMIGSFSAGPIYAAFPVSQSLLKKGASLSNVIIILSAWAVIKVPMLIVEWKFLGFYFMLTRYLLTVPAIILLGITIEKILGRGYILDKIKSTTKRLIDNINDKLPGYNCGSCGYDSCSDCAEAMINGDTDLETCTFMDERDQKDIKELLIENQ